MTPVEAQPGDVYCVDQTGRRPLHVHLALCLLAMLAALQGTAWWPSPRRQRVRIRIDRHKLQVADAGPVALSTIRSIEVLRGTEDNFGGWRAVILFGEVGQQQQALYAPLCLDAEYPADTVQQLVARVRAANPAVRVSDLDSSG